MDRGSPPAWHGNRAAEVVTTMAAQTSKLIGLLMLIGFLASASAQKRLLWQIGQLCSKTNRTRLPVTSGGVEVPIPAFGIVAIRLTTQPRGESS